MADNDDKPKTALPDLGGPTDEQCQLYELVQYQCEVTSTHIECNPFPRVFLRCTGRPTVEVTPEYDNNGDPIKSVLPDFGAVGSRKTPPGVAMMDAEKDK